MNRVGEKHFNNQGCKFEIIEYFGCDNCTIKFENGTIVEGVQYGNIERGNVKNPYYPSVFGVGYIGVGKYKAKVKNNQTKHYISWISMLQRSCDNNLKEKNPTYKDVIVCEEWKCFQNFAKWFEENYNPEVMEGWHLDKDILVKANKIYSPETCAFVPKEINSLFTKGNSRRGALPIGVRKHKNGKYLTQITKNSKNKHIGVFDTPEEAFQAYKIAKEKHIKEVADKWKDKIYTKVYEVLLNYKVEITD